MLRLLSLWGGMGGIEWRVGLVRVTRLRDVIVMMVVFDVVDLLDLAFVEMYGYVIMSMKNKRFQYLEINSLHARTPTLTLV